MARLSLIQISMLLWCWPIARLRLESDCEAGDLRLLFNTRGLPLFSRLLSPSNFGTLLSGCSFHFIYPWISLDLGGFPRSQVTQLTGLETALWARPNLQMQSSRKKQAVSVLQRMQSLQKTRLAVQRRHFALDNRTSRPLSRPISTTADFRHRCTASESVVSTPNFEIAFVWKPNNCASAQWIILFFNRWLPAGGHDSKLSGSWFSFCNGNKTWFQLHERWLGPPMSLSSIPREQYCEAESSRASRSNSGFIPIFGCFQTANILNLIFN